MFLFLIFRSRATIVADNSVCIVYNFVCSITTEEIAPSPHHKKACYGPDVVESSVAQGFTDRRKVMTPANEEIVLTMVNLYGLR